MSQPGFPLFPLGLVALPSELVPLHIFEDRYQTMIAECLDSGTEFGIVWMADDGLRTVGCACEIAEVLERMDDGRMNILTRGTRPFRVIERQEDLPYPAGEIEFLSDEPEEPDPEALEDVLDLAGAADRLRAGLGQPDDAELAVVLEQLVEHDPVALLEDVQRHELVGERDEGEGKQRKVTHGPIGHQLRMTAHDDHRSALVPA